MLLGEVAPADGRERNGGSDERGDRGDEQDEIESGPEGAGGELLGVGGRSGCRTCLASAAHAWLSVEVDERDAEVGPRCLVQGGGCLAQDDFERREDLTGKQVATAGGAVREAEYGVQV